MELVHLIYSSAAKDQQIEQEALNEILEQSRRNNQAADISGILLFQEGCFFQVLEGDKTTLEILYRKIFLDKRHTNVTKIVSEPIEERAFGEWTMGYPKVTKEELNSIDGLNDFFVQGRTFLDIGEGRARDLVNAFKGGKWRYN